MPKKGCRPCNPAVGSRAGRLDLVPPSRPHKPFSGSHVHIYEMNQSPPAAGCKCFGRGWRYRGGCVTSSGAATYYPSWRRRSSMSDNGNNERIFTYLDGNSVCVGDLVIAANQQAVVEKVIKPGSPDASDYSCSATGGLLLAFQNGDLQLWPSPRRTKISVSLDGTWAKGLRASEHSDIDTNGFTRWLSRDPMDNAEMSQGANLYQYLGNDPVDKIGIR